MNSLRCANNYHWQKQLRGSSTNRTIKYSILPIKQANNFNYMHTHIIIYNNRHIQPYSSLSWKLLFAYMNTKIQTMYKMIISTHAHFKQLAKLQWPKQTKNKKQKKQKRRRRRRILIVKGIFITLLKKKSGHSSGLMVVGDFSENWWWVCICVVAYERKHMERAGWDWGQVRTR